MSVFAGKQIFITKGKFTRQKLEKLDERLCSQNLEIFLSCTINLLA
jgi:hypothetical protein